MASDAWGSASSSARVPGAVSSASRRIQPLIDGGRLTVPFFRVFTPEGEWRVENEGVAPDLEVVLDPAAVNAGNDVQLDAAIADVLQQLKNSPEIPRKSAPPMPTQVGK